MLCDAFGQGAPPQPVTAPPLFSVLIHASRLFTVTVLPFKVVGFAMDVLHIVIFEFCV